MGTKQLLKRVVPERLIRARRLRIANQFARMSYAVNATWLGTPALKAPADLWIYQEIIAELRPDLIVETGTTRPPTPCGTYPVPRRASRGAHRFHDRQPGVDQSDVAERLRKVPEQLTRRRVDLLRQQPDVVRAGRRPLEERTCPLDLAGQGEALGEPERAEQEGALVARRGRRRSGTGTRGRARRRGGRRSRRWWRACEDRSRAGSRRSASSAPTRRGRRARTPA